MIIEEKKELILKSAIEVIARKGFLNTKIRDIATDASIGIGTFYNYFKSKDEIMDYIIIREFEKRSSVLKKSIENNKSLSLVINDILEYQMEVIRENPALIKLVMQETLQITESQNLEVQAILNENHKLMIDYIVQAQQKCEISNSFDSVYMAHSILYSIRSFAYNYVNLQANTLELEEMKKQILQFYVNGLA